jgi:hypothetical protein
MKLSSSYCRLLWVVPILCFTRVARPQENTADGKAVHLVAPNPKELMGWWTGDGDANDSLAQNNGRLYGGVTYVPGKVGQAFHLDGAKSYIKVPTSDLDPTRSTGFTVEMWIKPDTLENIQPVAGWSGTNTPGVSLWIEPAENGAAKLGADLRDTKGSAHRVLSDAPVVVARKWQHIALIYRKDVGAVELFHNGQRVRERQLGELEAQTSLDFYIGRHSYIQGGDVTFNGAIDEVSVISRALLSEEIQGLFAAQSAGKQLVSERDASLTKKERWASINKRLASFTKKHGGNAMNFAAWIDGSDEVHIQGDKVWFVHQDWDLPGKNGGANDPTWVNGEEWLPSWNENVSDKLSLATALPQSGELTLNIDTLKMGGNISPRGTDAQITLIQEPTAANNYEAVLRLDDNNDPGAHWFIFSVSWDEKN